VHLIANLAGIFAPVVLGYIVDSTGSWTLSFVVAGSAVLLAVFGRASRGPKAAATV
jgi:cyanate permease